MLNSKWIEFSPFNCHCFMETHFKHGKIKKKKLRKICFTEVYIILSSFYKKKIIKEIYSFKVRTATNEKFLVSAAHRFQNKTLETLVILTGPFPISILATSLKDGKEMASFLQKTFHLLFSFLVSKRHKLISVSIKSNHLNLYRPSPLTSKEKYMLHNN